MKFVCEYVHLDYILGGPYNEFTAVYEPVEERRYLIHNLWGYLLFDESSRFIRFRGGHQGLTTINLIVDSDEVARGCFEMRRGRFRIVWREYPADHVLRTYYDYGYVDEQPMFWLREGF